MAKFCNTCIHWEKIIPQVSGDNFGICQNVEVAGKVALDGQTHLGENGALWTEQHFGCVCWSSNNGSLLNTDAILKSNEQG